MKLKKIQLVSFILGMFLVLGVSSGMAATLDQPPGGGSDNIQLETDTVTIRVVGGQNVPMFQFWKTGDNTTTYKLQFVMAFEADDNAENGTVGEYDPDADMKSGTSVLALASLAWSFSEIDNRTDGSVHFNMTSDPIPSDGVVIQFNNHLEGADANSLKFDVIINNYVFSDDDNMLVLGFKLTQTDGEDEASPDAEQEDDTVNFGAGFFQSEETASAGGETINVGLSTGSEDNSSMIYLAYENFEGNLTHDPTVGVQSSSVSPGDTTTDDDNDGPALNASDETQNLWVQGISKEEAGLSTFIASFFALAIPVAIYRSRK